MNQPKTPPKPPSKNRQYTLILSIIVLIVGFGFLYVVNKDQKGSLVLPPELNTITEPKTGRADPASLPSAITGSHDSSLTPSVAADHQLKNQTAPSLSPQQAVILLPANTTNTPDTSPPAQLNPATSMQTDDALVSQTCLQASANLKSFYHTLDQRDYLTDFSLAADSQTHFSKLIQTMLEQPPTVSGETNDLFTLLQNTAHFFQIFGKDNILLLKSIINNEQNEIEHLAATLYTLTRTPSCSDVSQLIQLSPEGLYDYAGFFLNTMAGRLYLFRRDSFSRLLVNYYSVLIMNDANLTNRNRHGIHLLPAITALISDLEQSGETLRYREEYLDQLYLLQEQYQ